MSPKPDRKAKAKREWLGENKKGTSKGVCAFVCLFGCVGVCVWLGV